MIDTETPSPQQEVHFDWLCEVAYLLAEISDLTEIDQGYQIVAHKAALLTHGGASIHRFEATTHEFILVYETRQDNHPTDQHNCACQDTHAKVAQEHRTFVICNRLDTADSDLKPSDSAYITIVVIPLKSGANYYGNLCVMYQEVNTPHDKVVKFCEAIALQLALALYRLELATALRLTEQRAVAAEALSASSASIFELTHRLGNDLGLISSYVEDIRNKLRTKGVAMRSVDQDLERILEDVTRVLALSASVKESFSGFADRLSATTTDLSPATMMREIIGSLPRLPNNVKIELDIADDIALVHADHGQTADILRNLITNAIEAMSSGGTLALRACNSGQFVEFQVADTGVGIAKNELSRIFDLFYSTKGGFGFGLWSARRHALANGGELTCSSEVGKGTVFTLILPMTKRS